MLPVVVLVAAGMLLVLAEVVLPGGVVGILGFVCMAAGSWIAFNRFGSSTGMAVVGLSIAGGLTALYLAYRVLPGTGLGKKLYLATASQKNEPDKNVRQLTGTQGVCESDLRPAGIAVFGDNRVDVVSRGEFIQSGTAVKVVEVTGNRVVVKKVE